jgi:superfamily II DNA or RNA helicase
MALRLDPIRLFIADDVGVGKTIEALLIAREMLDRGEIKRLCVLTPPALCEQWQGELAQRMNLEPVVIRSGTVTQLERRKAGAESIYRYYPIQIASIDFVKSERNRHLFLQDCPEMVIVDEAHGAATATGDQNHQQRHELLRDLAATSRHLIMLTATPHSGVDASFRSLLSLLHPDFGQWDLASLDDAQRKRLAQHYVQRTRKDIESSWETDHCFPDRIPDDRTYALSAASKSLFDKTFAFCTELVRTGASLDQRRQRVRYWSALALLRCVMSSPAAALAALETRHNRIAESGADDQPDFMPQVFESSNERTDDEQPLPAIEAGEATLEASEKKRLRELGRLAAATLESAHDTKLSRCIEILGELLDEGFNPIVWCRYIATANYLAEALNKAWARTRKTTQVVAVISQTGDDEERRKLIAAIEPAQPRVLVATDCLSEGVNLQETFNAAPHYDLPWNPNRLEQREGRVDRYGQPSPTVKTFRYFGADNPVDGVVIDVLLNKAREIHKALGTHVPVPAESDTVTQAVLNALFLRGRNQTRCELDAAIFHLYLPAKDDGTWRAARVTDGSVIDETPEQLAELTRHFPTPRHAVSHILDSFPLVRKKDEEAHGGYRTKERILEIYDGMLAARRDGREWVSPLDPPPGHA